jgi:D-alanyl-D-alanine carboxypeptidase
VRRIIACLIVILLTILMSVWIMADNVAAVEWDGEDSFDGDKKTYVVTKPTAVKTSVTIPAGVTVSVKSGGNLIVGKAADFTVVGSIEVEENATLQTMGKVSFAAESSAKIDGKWLIKKDARVTVSSEILTAGTAQISLQGKLSVTKTGKITGKGKISFDYFTNIENEGEITATLVPPKPKVTDGVTYVGEILIANKQHSLPKTYGSGLLEETSAAFELMKKDAKTAGFNLNIISGFRSYEHQERTYAYWCNLYGEDYAKMISAKAGTSEHQTGLAIDINSLQTSYGDTAEGKWLAANCHKYGFIIRYPKDKTAITGYNYEPWHLRYLGTQIAAQVYKSGLCLEEYVGIGT